MNRRAGSRNPRWGRPSWSPEFSSVDLRRPHYVGALIPAGVPSFQYPAPRPCVAIQILWGRPPTPSRGRGIMGLRVAPRPSSYFRNPLLRSDFRIPRPAAPRCAPEVMRRAPLSSRARVIADGGVSLLSPSFIPNPLARSISPKPRHAVPRCNRNIGGQVPQTPIGTRCYGRRRPSPSTLLLPESAPSFRPS